MRKYSTQFLLLTDFIKSFFQYKIYKQYMLKSFLLLLLLLQLGSARLGFDFTLANSVPSLSNLRCVASKESAEFTSVILYDSDKGLSPSANEVLINLKNLGIPNDITMQICASKDASTQINQVMSAIPGSLYNMIWVIVVDSLCSWESKSVAERCTYIQKIVSIIRSKGKQVGIISQQVQWQRIFKNANACPSVANGVPLWYFWNDNKKSFSGFSKFGGWQYPTAKTYTLNIHDCGMIYNGVYRT